MKYVEKDIDAVLDLESKKKILDELGQADMIDLFKKNYKPTYAPIGNKKTPLDQSIALAITEDEKDFIVKELNEIRRTGSKASYSTVIRNRALLDIDLVEWKERAKAGLSELNGPNWDKGKITREKKKLLAEIAKANPNDEEVMAVYNHGILECDTKLSLLERPNIKRGYRLRGRVTFDEANHIRWRAGRLNLTVADYMRFMLFDYLPFSEDDKTLTIENRKRFYISILDVAVNGWGAPTQVDSCQSCLRYREEIKELREKLKRLKTRG